MAPCGSGPPRLLKQPLRTQKQKRKTNETNNTPADLGRHWPARAASGRNPVGIEIVFTPISPRSFPRCWTTLGFMAESRWDSATKTNAKESAEPRERPGEKSQSDP
jgi:hypothetical protein